MGVGGKLAYIGLPKIFFEFYQRYFRMEVEGIEHLPKRGNALITPNHSGCSGLDAALLAGVLSKEIHRIPRILTLWSLFRCIPALEGVAGKMGLKPASAWEGLKVLKKNQLAILFPEGVKGSFKPTSKMYQLQPFQNGFMKLSLLTGAPIVPCVIIGAEESNINMGMIDFKTWFHGLALPIPLNLLPLPAKWKIKFLPKIDPQDWNFKDLDNKIRLKEAVNKIQEIMQAVINEELAKRNYIYFGKSSDSPKRKLNESILSYSTSFSHVTSISRYRRDLFLGSKEDKSK